MKVEVMSLNYAMGALSPYISENTMNYHYGKHLQSYVNTLKDLIANTEMETMPVEDIFLKAEEGPLFNNAGQVLNHNLYFQQFAPESGRKEMPSGELEKAIATSFSDFAKMQEEMNAAATSLFGSGWIWLAADERNNLSIHKCPNGTNPLREGLIPLLGIDVWEHAYYLDYQNLRASHVKALWNIIDWKVIEERFLLR
ncbi:MAG: superoxide dismutase [Bacteroidaceae bacterium]|nr:superoxide dismutase [Bacteroidaceae bacterium]